MRFNALYVQILRHLQKIVARGDEQLVTGQCRGHHLHGGTFDDGLRTRQRFSILFAIAAARLSTALSGGVTGSSAAEYDVAA
jgi:hypothetical protein